MSSIGGNDYDVLRYDHATFIIQNYPGGSRLGTGLWAPKFKPTNTGALTDANWGIDLGVGLGVSVGTVLGKEVAKMLVAKTGTKLISQFSSSTIDAAVVYAMKNKVTHVFCKAAHNLDPLVTKLGGQENTFRTVLNAANGKLPARGIFNNVPVNVGGYNVNARL